MPLDWFKMDTARNYCFSLRAGTSFPLIRYSWTVIRRIRLNVRPNPDCGPTVSSALFYRLTGKFAINRLYLDREFPSLLVLENYVEMGYGSDCIAVRRKTELFYGPNTADLFRTFLLNGRRVLTSFPTLLCPHQVTMHHMDHPSQYIFDFHGWANRKMADKFEEYADFLFATFGDRVRSSWDFTKEVIQEPQRKMSRKSQIRAVLISMITHSFKGLKAVI